MEVGERVTNRRVRWTTYLCFKMGLPLRMGESTYSKYSTLSRQAQ